MPLVVVVAGGVAGPDDKVYLVFDVLVDEVERFVDEGKGAVAGSRFGAVDAGAALAAMAGRVRSGRRVRFVEGVGVEVYNRLGSARCAGGSCTNLRFAGTCPAEGGLDVFPGRVEIRNQCGLQQAVPGRLALLTHMHRARTLLRPET